MMMMMMMPTMKPVMIPRMIVNKNLHQKSLLPKLKFSFRRSQQVITAINLNNASVVFVFERMFVPFENKSFKCDSSSKLQSKQYSVCISLNLIFNPPENAWQHLHYRTPHDVQIVKDD
jgi:hypothetical protein